jgi:hypothetical protein
MKKMLWAMALTGLVAGAQEKTAEFSLTQAGADASQTKDPLQTRREQSTQIVTNTGKGNAPVNYKGAATVDDDLRQRVLVALSTGSIGTQGVISSDQLTDIKVSVTNRMVTLRGDVASEKNKQTLGKRVAGLDGVKSVSNNLTINPNVKAARQNLLKPDGYSPGTKDQRTQDGRRVEEVNREQPRK